MAPASSAAPPQPGPLSQLSGPASASSANHIAAWLVAALTAVVIALSITVRADLSARESQAMSGPLSVFQGTISPTVGSAAQSRINEKW